MKQRPFLKWAGNKYRIIDRIKAGLPSGGRLIEPFVGSGAVFLNTRYPEYLLADNNTDLILLYQTLQREGPAFIAYIKGFFTEENNQAHRYYRWREEFNRTADQGLKAALFVYLNRFSYNGLCRYNSKGGFNAPFGRYKRPYFPEKEMLHFYCHSQKAVFKRQDFSVTMGQARPGDIVYCDPPYVPLSATASFTGYSVGGFGLAEQNRLARLAQELAGRGIPVLISNHATDFTRQAYSGARLEFFQVQRLISCDGTNRGKAGEVLALFEAESGKEETIRDVKTNSNQHKLIPVVL